MSAYVKKPFTQDEIHMVITRLMKANENGTVEPALS
jgi:two-component SAPR family response regulator